MTDRDDQTPVTKTPDFNIVGMEKRIHVFGNVLVGLFHNLALFAIGGATVWSAFFAFLDMAESGTASVAEILLLFIYLEIGAMVGIYFKTKHLPVRYLIYISITVLARFMIETISIEHKSGWAIPVLSGSILLLSLAALALRYGSFKFPAYEPENEATSIESQSKQR